MRSRSVAPNSTSYVPGLATWPDRQNSLGPVDVGVPICAYASPPIVTMCGMLASVSTLLTTVGLPNSPISTGNGGLLRGSPRLPSIDSKRAVSSPQMYAPAPRRSSMSKVNVGAQDRSTQQPGGAGGIDRVSDTGLGLGVFAADIQVADARAGREGRDGHRLDDGERVALQQDAVLERAGLGFVGVAHEVVRLGGLRSDRGPLPAGGEGGAAAAHQAGRRDLGDDRLGPHLQGLGQRRVAAVGTVVVERRRVGDTDPREQAGAAAGRGDGARCASGGRGLQARQDAGGVGWGDGRSRGRVAGTRHERGRRQVAQAQARGPQPAHRPVASGLALRSDRPAQGIADPLRARDAAGDVVAHVGHDRWPRLRGIQRVERGDAIGLRRRHGEPLRDVVEGRLADPADSILDGVEGGQQLRPARTDGVARRGMRSRRHRAAAARRPSRSPAGRGRRPPPRARRGSPGGR